MSSGAAYASRDRPPPAHHRSRTSSKSRSSRPSHGAHCAMCEYTKHYWVWTTCLDPGAHYFRVTVDGDKDQSCQSKPHERYIVVEGLCGLCYPDSRGAS